MSWHNRPPRGARRERGSDPEQWARACRALDAANAKKKAALAALADHVRAIRAEFNRLVPDMDLADNGEVTWNGNYILRVRVGQTAQEVAAEVAEAMQYI